MALEKDTPRDGGETVGDDAAGATCWLGADAMTTGELVALGAAPNHGLSGASHPASNNESTTTRFNGACL